MVELTASSERSRSSSRPGRDGLDPVDRLWATVLGMASGNRGLGLYGFRLQAGEADRPCPRRHPEGVYSIRARTRDGRVALGSAVLSHRIPGAPVPIYPQEGEVGVPASGLRVSWVPDPVAARYQVNLEQGETDLLAVSLRSGTGSFTVPDGVLASGCRYKLEIGAVGAEGNCTFREVSFLTR